MKFTEILLKEGQDIWNSYYEHPFVKGIGTGELEQDKFRFYIIQDYLYLLDYAKIFALGVIKSDDENTMQTFAKLLDGILNSEMGIHRHYMRTLDITQEEIYSHKKSLINISYTHYMMAVSHNGSLAEIVVSLLACMWSYHLIGKKLSEISNSIEHPFYGEWIKTYISKGYVEINDWLISLTDEVCMNLSLEQKNKLIEIFINTSKYEYLFWDMAYNQEA